MSAGHNAATNVLARCLFGLSASTFNKPDADAPDFAADFEEAGEHAVSALVELPSGDRYRLTVAWLGEESP